jgi:hypothetical protein
MLELSFYPYAVILQVTPVVSIAPLIFIYVDSKIAGMLLVRMAGGLLSGAVLHDAGAEQRRSQPARPVPHLRRDPLARLRYLQLPSALPYFLGGLKIAGGLSLIGAVVAELVAGTGGIGSGLAFRIQEAGYRLNIARMFAALALGRGDGGVHLCGAQHPVPPLAAQMARKCPEPGGMMDFTHLPHGDVTLANVTVPACLIGQTGDLVHDRHLDQRGPDRPPQAIAVDMQGAMVFPGLRRHAHPSGQGPYLAAQPQPRRQFHGRADHRARRQLRAMDGRGPARADGVFAALCLCPRHTRDPHPSGQRRAARRHHWPVFREMQAEWAGKIDAAGRLPDRLRQVDG